MNKIIYPYLPPGRVIKFVSENNSFMYGAKMVSKKTGCLKQPTGAVIVKNNSIIGKGANAGLKIDFCPRIKKGSRTGEDYHFCKNMCFQDGHAEVMAIKNAKENGADTNQADLYLYGHWWCCKNCWDEIIKAGIKNVYLAENAHTKFNFK